MPEASLSTRFLIVGAGPTGLGAAYRLKEVGETDFLVVDSAPQVGGLSASFKDSAGFTWDLGGHVQFSHYDYFDRVMDEALGKEGWYSHERQSWVWMRGRFIPYPLQNNIRHLPAAERWACVRDLMSEAAKPGPVPRNFGEWLTRSFGSALTSIFMRPYNWKVWAHTPEEMSYQWIGERVATINLERILKNIILEQDDVSWGPNNVFRFPKSGGTGAIWESLASRIGRERILLSSEVIRIEPKSKRAFLRDGRCVAYEKILSTMPIDLLTTKVEGLLPHVSNTSRCLKHSSTHVVGIGLEGEMPESLRGKCWMYFPENDCPFYRVTVFSNYSPAHVPDSSRNWSLMAEVSESPQKPLSVGKPGDASSLIRNVIEGMRNTKLIPGDSKVVSQWSRSLPHGYPTPSVERDEILSRVQPELERLGIQSRGRFGGWKYEVSNQDHSFMQGVEWADHQVNGSIEITLDHPEKVNATTQKSTLKAA